MSNVRFRAMRMSKPLIGKKWPQQAQSFLYHSTGPRCKKPNRNECIGLFICWEIRQSFACRCLVKGRRVFVTVKQQIGHGLIGTNVEPLPLDPRELITDCWLKYQTSLTRNEHIVLLRLQNPFVSALWSQQSVSWVTKKHQDWRLTFYISVLYWSVGGPKARRGINK